MLYAHVTGGTVEQVGALPSIWFDGTRWWNIAGGAIDPADIGWLPVTVEPRPDDTATTTWDRNEPAIVAGLPVIGWTERDKTPDELQAEADAAAARARYETHEGILDATAALMESAHEDGAAWVAPEGAHNAYPLGRTVTHGGKTWENITPANVWEPGVSGWREVVAEGYPAWVAPTGSHDAYNIGDRVSFEGQNYESVINGNTWSPTEYPAGWTLLP